MYREVWIYNTLLCAPQLLLCLCCHPTYNSSAFLLYSSPRYRQCRHGCPRGILQSFYRSESDPARICSPNLHRIAMYVDRDSCRSKLRSYDLATKSLHSSWERDLWDDVTYHAAILKVNLQRKSSCKDLHHTYKSFTLRQAYSILQPRSWPHPLKSWEAPIILRTLIEAHSSQWCTSAVLQVSYSR